MTNDKYLGQRISRRALLGAGLAGIGVNGARILGVPLEQVRCVSADVGGGVGTKLR